MEDSLGESSPAFPFVVTSLVLLFAVASFARHRWGLRPKLLAPGKDGVFHVGSRWGLRIVCLSDTHGKHRDLEVPHGDVLLHAGDFTLFGQQAHAEDFNAWLQELPHAQKVVIVGNHENNAPWHKAVEQIVSSAKVLRNSGYSWEGGPRIHGTDFFWNVQGSNPYFDAIAEGVDVLMAHNPPAGVNDSDKRKGGCPALLATVRRLRPALVISGHLHAGHGVASLRHPGGRETICVNAANCGHGRDERRIVHPPIVLDI